MTVYEKYSKNAFFSVGLVALVAVAAIVILVLQSGIIPSVGKGSYGLGGANGDSCTVDSDCDSWVCGLSNTGIQQCTEKNVDVLNDWCQNDLECGLGLWCDTIVGKCVYTSFTDVCGECGENSVCGVEDGIRSCVPFGSDPLGSECVDGIECASYVCGITQQNEYRCVEVYQDRVGENCHYLEGYEECESSLCGINSQGATICVEPFQDLGGASCLNDEECQSDSCEWSNEKCAPIGVIANGYICEYNRDCMSGYCNSNERCADRESLGSACSWDYECDSHVCGLDTQGNNICVDPQSDPLGALCNANRECQTGICGADQQGNTICVNRGLDQVGDNCHSYLGECALGSYCNFEAFPSPVGRCE